VTARPDEFWGTESSGPLDAPSASRAGLLQVQFDLDVEIDQALQLNRQKLLVPLFSYARDTRIRNASKTDPSERLASKE